LEELPNPFLVRLIGPSDLELHVDGEYARSFRVLDLGTLTRSAAEAAVHDAGDGATVLVVYRRSSPDARDLLRDAGLSYVGADGRVLLQASPVFIDRERAPGQAAASVSDWSSASEGLTAARNPFAVRSSRVARWLLLHGEESFSIGELAKRVELSGAAVSRAVQALDQMALVETSSSDVDARTREVRLKRPVALLEAWLPNWQRRRLQRVVWDIDAQDVGHVLDQLQTAALPDDLQWAIGGLVGASQTGDTYVVPSDVVVWIAPEGIATLADGLMPTSSRGGRGTLRVTATPDPWTLSLASRPGALALPVVDPVQLWLDCSSEGERALEAAAGIAYSMGWT
jgi:DNA-binding transcriptional ArsR family regulator